MGAAIVSTLRIAWRNLWRNRRRTALALSAIGLSAALVLVYDGVLRAYGDWMLEAITGPMLGHVQAHAPGWRKDRGMDRTLRGVGRAVEAARRDPGVAGASARVYAPALAALGEEGFAVVVVGAEPGAESGPMRLLGAMSAPLGGRRALMGRALADLMGVRTGAVIAIVGQGADGSLANDLFTVSGLAETSVDLINRQGVIVDLAEAQELFAMPDEAHEIVVHARDPETVRALAERLGRLPELAGTEVLDWQALAPEMLTLVRLVRVAWVFVLVLVFVAAAAGVANTMLMATFERTHEFGMLLALGTAPRRIIWLIVAEALALGLVGALLGVALGGTLVALTHRTGIDYATLTGGGPKEISFAGLRWSLRLYPSLTLVDMARVVAAVVVTSLAACAWPAARAARLQPARALRE
jgi:ABC-type lipoprotein release transport system permease subunit